jgi:hypothetical protein
MSSMFASLVWVNSLISTKPLLASWSLSRSRPTAPTSCVLESTSTATWTLLAPRRVTKVDSFPEPPMGS